MREPRRIHGGALKRALSAAKGQALAAKVDADRLDLPTGFLGRTPFLSLRGQEEADLVGCVEILCYSEEKILLRLTKGCVCIRGKHLNMRSYHRCRATVAGKIEQLSFAEAEEAVEQ